MRRIRLAIFGASPCNRCWAACCKQNGHDFAALLAGDEVRRFRAYATTGNFTDAAGRSCTEFVLPYVNGQCVFLGADNLCQVYEDRPAACRAFECTRHFGTGIDASGGDPHSHGIFLIRNPQVLTLLEQL